LDIFAFFVVGGVESLWIQGFPGPGRPDHS
jgi:hypothetical protein